MPDYTIRCECAHCEITMTGQPHVVGNCHCVDCRELLNLPYYALSAWLPEQLSVSKGKVHTATHPQLEMTRNTCPNCGEVLYNTNAMGWKLVNALLVQKNYHGEIPAALVPDKHFWYAQRIVSIDDDLPKYD